MSTTGRPARRTGPSRKQNTIEVAVRVRPTGRGDDADTRALANFDYPSHVVLGSDQPACFAAVGRDLLNRMRSGFNVTIMAYGQTGSGKTYTMFGPTGSLTEASLGECKTAGAAPRDWGVFPRIALAMVRDASGTGLRASAVEIYNNSPFDLLNDRKPLHVSRSKNAGASIVRARVKGRPEGATKFQNSKVGLNGEHPGGCACRGCFLAEEEAKKARKLRIANARADKSGGSMTRRRRVKRGGVNVVGGGGDDGRTPRGDNGAARTVGETLWDLATPADVARFARQIEMSRVAAGHALNDRSSRSHCLVRLQSTTKSSDGRLRKQCFTFVDLAGSERTGKSRVEGQRMSEAITINNSLTVLGRCIRAVGTGKAHVPWRDAVLCQLLKTSFSGNGATHTSVVVNISPEHADETLCTLRFGERVACVKNRATVVVGSDAEGEIASLRRQVSDLRARKRAMDAEGLGSGFVEGCIHSERVSLQKNMDKLAVIEARVGELKTRLVEAGGGRALRERLAAAQAERDVVWAITSRQQTIKKLWRDATPGYKAVAAQLADMENQLRTALM